MATALLELLRRNADYRRLFLATLVSFMGDWFAFVAVSGFVTEATGRGGLAAVVYAATVLPVFFLSPVAGAVADRMDRKRLLVAADLARVIPSLGLLAALWLGSPALAIGCMALLAALSSFFEPVSAAVVPNLLEKGDLSLGQAAISSLWGSMLFVGAAVGGLVAATLGREASFAFNAATFLLSAWLVVRIRRPLQDGRLRRPAGLREDLAEVLALARRSHTTRALLVTKVGVGVANGIVGLLPVFALARFGAGDAGVGLLLAARGLGALVGPFIGRALARDDGRRLLLVCGGSIVSFGLAYTLLPLTSSLGAAVGCIVLAHLGGGAQWALSTYGLQVSTPDGLRGRVLGLDFGLVTLGIGVSSLAASGAAEAFGLEPASFGLAGVALVYGAAWLWWASPLWRGGEDPLRVTSASGPRGTS